MPDAKAVDYGIAITPAQGEALARFAELIRRWSRFAKLVSREDETRIHERHLKDSLSLVAVLAQLENPLRIADVGSGAGLPGVPLAVVLPEAHVTLIERSAKKSRFLERVAMELSLPNVDVVCDDVVNVTAKYDVVVSRAVMAPDKLWPLAFRILRAEGHMMVLDRVHDAGAGPPADSVEAFPGGIVTRRSWSQMPESRALHGVLVVRCQAS
ncbi:MAG: 16S rRNA (guanine(527)-N(7))-methyltransferase RsmG [Gammaproteobacteria bacterium]|nr:16S rRNA (guanine(527)-N(7))-methyltransferase RsmG [Gammaproteobacteria bacterium]